MLAPTRSSPLDDEVPSAPTGDLTVRFARDGFVGPIDLLTAEDCRFLARYFDDPARPRPLDWFKGLGAADPIVFDLACRPRLIDCICELLGPDVVLYGASIIDRVPGEAHPWHTDIDASQQGTRCVSAWIGLEHTSIASSLKLLRGSHRIGRPLQQVAAACGCPRPERDAAAALEMGRASGCDLTLVEPAMRDGQALLFDGRLWHGSLNAHAAGRRRALLLQYATADSKLYIPDFASFDWPFRFRDTPRPPVVTVAGRGNGRINRIVAAPGQSATRRRCLASLAQAIPWPLQRNTETGWRPTRLYDGLTAVLSKLGCHASVLEPGHCPHPPHAHRDEELLVVLDGVAEVVIADGVGDASPRIERLSAGDLAYYPAYLHHTLRCPGPGPVSYLMYRWHAPFRGGSRPLEAGIFRRPAFPSATAGRGFSIQRLFEGPTESLDKLHLHWSRVTPGGGYASHADLYDVAILLLSGSVSTLGRTIHAPAVVLYPAGELHGLRGAGEAAAEYIVVEFHGPRSAPSGHGPFRRSALRGLLTRMGRRLRHLRAPR